MKVDVFQFQLIIDYQSILFEQHGQKTCGIKITSELWGHDKFYLQL